MSKYIDEIEFLHVRLHGAEELEKLIHGGDFLQAVHVMAWLLAKEADTRCSLKPSS
ncbi:MAG: hypothetical protein Q4A32_03230 [Lachnospiraceae bacterium]|nr:hypothetical protein [Lachnospiraceae bacterium]